MALVEALQKKLMSYTLQDLVRDFYTVTSGTKSADLVSYGNKQNYVDPVSQSQGDVAFSAFLHMYLLTTDVLPFKWACYDTEH